jgi:hypothetical protein
MVILYFCVIKLHYHGDYHVMAVNYHGNYHVMAVNYHGNYHVMAINYHGKKFIHWPMVSISNPTAMYNRILTLQNVGTG